MSKLADRLYRWFYGKPLARFFQEYWQKTEHFPVLLNELAVRVKIAPENQEMFTHLLQTDPVLNEMVLEEFLAEGVLTDAFLDWLASDAEHMQEFMRLVEQDEQMGRLLISGLWQQKAVQEHLSSWLTMDIQNVRQFLTLLNQEQHRPLLHKVLLQLHVPQAALPEWLLQDKGRTKRFINGLIEADSSVIDTIEESLFRYKTPTERFLQWLALSEANPRKFMAELRLSSESREQFFAVLQNDSEIREEMNQALWQNDRVVNEFLDYIARDDEKRKIFLRELGERENFRSVLRVMHDQETLSKLTYALPTVTSSFPRSGSNFFQSVLRGSSGLQCISLYHSQYPQEQVFNLKSHALTPAALRREFADMVPYELEYPEKIIYLKRDPRDVMISLYEFACFNHEQAFALDEFLGMNYYFVANPPGVRGVKNIYYLPGPEACTVEEAFRLYHQSHLHAPQHESAVETLTLSYEEMVEDPENAFNRAFTFLDLDCPLNPEFIQLKVSLYSDSTRKRGVAYGWRQPETQEKYAPLLEQVNEVLKDQIVALGYGAM